MEEIQSFFAHSPTFSMVAAFVLLCLASCFANFVVKRLLLSLIRHLLLMTPWGNDDEIVSNEVISRLANIIPALVFTVGIAFVPAMPKVVTTVIQNVASAFIILTIAMAASAALDVVNTLYLRRPNSENHPIKGYLQLLKIVIYLIAIILIISELFNKSPIILLSGLGAMAAVLILVFQDTLLSFVASVQISSNNMVKVGDWIEMPQLNTDGEIIDIALHTVKVQNWDMTISTLPTRRLISDPVKNWRGMQESGGRRIKKTLYIDQATIHFLTEEEKAHLFKFEWLKTYLEEEKKAKSEKLTNMGIFRAYVFEYLKNRDDIYNDKTLIVRYLDPGSKGLPLEIYCFATTTVWDIYEAIQADILDHLYSVLPEFGLRVYQQPSGYDVQDFQGKVL